MTSFLYAHGELFFCLCGFAWLVRCRLGWRGLLSFGGYLLFVLICRDAHETGIVGTHALSMAHILFSWAGKTAAVMAVCTWLCEGWTGCRQLVRTAAVCISGAIVLGMIWAFDAPGWGALWQWDSVETFSLGLWIALWAWQKQPGDLWGLVTLFCLSCEMLGIYGGLSDLSRHSYGYGDGALISASGWMCWLVWCGVCALGGHRVSSVSGIRMRTCACALAGIMGLALCGIALHPMAMCLGIGGIWALLNTERRVSSLCLVSAGLILLCVCSMDSEPGVMVTASLDAVDGWRLVGIAPSAGDVGDRLNLTAYLVSPKGHEFELVFETWDGQPLMPLGYADIWPEFVRVYGGTYRATKGVDMLVRQIALWRVLELILLVLCGIGACLSVKKCRAEAEEDACEEHERRERQKW
ncbi:MAG: hypothetical protein IKY83_06770 [Proteobacteria bacterium]|nr:hypothetical protein [Pseudomonadota bacterium]